MLDWRIDNVFGYDVIAPQTERGVLLTARETPGGLPLLLPETITQPVIAPSLAILHSNSGNPRVPWWQVLRWYRRPEVTGEPHFEVSLDGTVAQFMPTNRRADCNAKANAWTDPTGRVRGAVSFETQDDGGPTVDRTPWTAEQIESICQILAALIAHYPDMTCTSPTHFRDRGIGYHSQYPEWSIYKGKTCPGHARIRQMDYVRRRVAELVVANRR